MMDESFEKYMLLGIERKIFARQYIEYEIFLILLSLPLIIVGHQCYLLLLPSVLPAIAHTFFIVKIGKGKKIEGVKSILYNGVLATCISWLFGLMGIVILSYLYDGKKRMIGLCIVGGGYFLLLFVYGCIVRKISRAKKAYHTEAIGISFTLCGALGGTVASNLLNGASNQQMIEILYTICFFLSYISLLGVFNLYKFRYLMKHQEILIKYQDEKPSA